MTRIHPAAIAVLLAISAAVHAQSVKTARAAMEEAARKPSAAESLSFLKAAVPKLPSGAERRSGTALLGGVQEQMGLFDDAQRSYAAAAAMKAGDAEGMPRKSSEQLVVDAVRCALSLGDAATAENYLRSDVRKSKDAKIIAYTRLYEQWSVLCRAQTPADTRGAVAQLSSYASQKSMAVVAPAVLLTLWHVTGDESWAAKLKKSYPGSMEAGIVRGVVQQLPTPFWYFVPRSGSDVPEIADSAPSAAVARDREAPTQTATKEQLGLFRDESNAKRLVEKLKASGFPAKIAEEQRSGGSKYYLVYVAENEDCSMGELLRAAGFECYPLFE